MDRDIILAIVTLAAAINPGRALARSSHFCVVLVTSSHLYGEAKMSRLEMSYPVLV